MRFALISDIHANVHALIAVINDLTDRGLIDRVYHLGDLVGYAAFPDDTVNLVRNFRIQGIAGNYDSTVATQHAHCGCRYEDDEQERLSHISYDWTLKNTRTSTKQQLAYLPFRMDLRPKGGHRPGAKVVLVHGTPTLNTLYWHDDRPATFCTKMASVAGAKPGDLIAFGHTHLPWFREVEGVYYLNAGSVGRPKDGDWRAGYAIVDVSGKTPEVEFARVEYDLEAACAGIRKSTLPDFFAEYLATGGTARPTPGAALA